MVTYGEIDWFKVRIEAQIDVIVGCAACLVYGRTTDSNECFVKRMTVLILLVSISSYRENVFQMKPSNHGLKKIKYLPRKYMQYTLNSLKSNFDGEMSSLTVINQLLNQNSINLLYIWNVSHQLFGLDPVGALQQIIQQISFSIILITQPLVYWYFGYKYWITSKMLLIDGPKDYREKRRRHYECLNTVFVISISTVSLLIGSFLSLQELYYQKDWYKQSRWRYFDINLAFGDSVSTIFLICSMRNFSKARRLQIVYSNPGDNYRTIVLFTVFCISEILLNIFTFTFRFLYFQECADGSEKFVLYDGMFSIISSIGKKVSTLIILAVVDKINQNAKQLRTYEAVYFDDGDEIEDDEFEPSIGQLTDQISKSPSTLKSRNQKKQADPELSDKRDLEQKLREQLLLSSDSQQHDDRQSLYVNLLEIRTRKSDQQLEEQGITHMFIEQMDPTRRRKHIKENKDTYTIGIKRRKPRKKRVKQRRSRVLGQDEQVDRQYKTEVLLQQTSD